MSVECEIVIRPSRGADLPARAQLVRDSIAEYNMDATILFFFQELTLQVVVLCGAVLFIFCGVSAGGCALLVPAAAAAAHVAVRLAHSVAADKLQQSMHHELYGFVAELRGPILVNPVNVRDVKIRTELKEQESTPKTDYRQYCRVVGSVSVEEAWGAGRGGRLRGLGVARAWRRRGVGRALLAAATRRAAADGLDALDAVATQLHDAARTLLHSQGWECRGAYQRPLLGTALTLQVAQFARDITHA